MKERLTKFISGWALGANLLLAATACARAEANSQAPVREDRLGVCTHFGQHWSVEGLMPLIARSGVGWIRDELGWGALEPTPGKYQIPPQTRAWIGAARRAGLKIDLILAYGNRAYPDHYDTEAYAKAAAWLAGALASDVEAIEILNEPNNFGFRTTYGGTWNGNEPAGAVAPYLRKYVELLNAAAKEIKLATPQMTVIGLGAPPPANFRMIALGLASQVDGLTDHPYPAQLPELVPYAANPEMLRRDGLATADLQGTFLSQVSMFRAQAKKYGATEKLWHTEWGYSTVRAQPDKRKPGLTEEAQAVYILRRILQSTAAGVEHSFIYDFQDDGTNPDSDYENFGLIKNNRSPKQSYFALQRLTGLLAEMRMAAPDHQARIEGTDPAAENNGLGRQCPTFSSSDGQKTLVAFWEAKPWEPIAQASSAVVTWPLAPEPRRLTLYDPLTGKETQIPWKKSGDNQISITVPISSAPKLLIAR